MPTLSEHAVFIFVSQLGVILLFARIFGEIAKKLDQPIIVGEVLAGIILGPSFFGHFFPQLRETLFPIHGTAPYLLQGISWLCVIFLLLITGLEIDLRAALRQGKQSVYISLFALILSLLGIFAFTSFLPGAFFPEGTEKLYVKLLTALALSVVAIPVIAKILYDLKILKSEVGIKILTTGVLSDVWGWTILAVIIALISGETVQASTIIKPLLTMILYLTLTLSIGQKVVDRFLNVIGYKEMDTSMSLSLLFSLALINGAIAHMMGIHVIFGAFIAGVMAGESEKITPYVRQWTSDFIFAIFAPIFFVLIGMQLQFSGFNHWGVFILLFIVSSILKLAGVYFASIMTGFGKKNAFALACGLNTQGTMGIVIALIGYEMGVFNDTLFSSIVMICVLTSLGVGPLLKWAIQGVKRPLADYFDKSYIFLDVEGSNKGEIIHSMVKHMAQRKIIKTQKDVEHAILEREAVISTAIGDGIALPHARLPNIKKPIICFFRLKVPIDYGSPDNKPVSMLFLELTDKKDDGMQLNIIAQISRIISFSNNRERLLAAQKEEDIYNILSFDDKA